jgi:hypothetical protein
MSNLQASPAHHAPDETCRTGTRFLRSCTPEQPDERAHIALDHAIDATLAIQ